MKRLLFYASSLCLLLAGCKNASESKEYASLDMADTAVSITGLTGDSVKMVKTASINCKVKDAHQSTRAVSRLAQSLGGMISHQNVESYQNESKELPISDDSLLVITSYTTQATITARVPAQNLEEFMYGITRIGYFTTASRMDIDDRSLDYLAAGLKQQNRIQVIKGNTNTKTKGLTSAQLIQTKDEAVDQEIVNRRIDADVQYSTVQLNLSQNPIVQKEIIANYSIAGYELSFGKRLQSAFNNGWVYFLDFLLVLAYLWPFILLTIAGWMLFKYLKLRSAHLNRT